MPVDIRKASRPVLLIGAVTAGALGWTFIRPDATQIFVPFLPDSGVADAAIDAATIDAPDAAAGSPTTAWTMHVIKDGLSGPDGVDTTIIGGKLHVITPWEQS